MAPQQTRSTIKYRKAPAPTDEYIYNSMLDAIIDQRLAPGTRLTEADLCGIYATTRRKIERVLVRLETEGVVTIELNRGARISRPTQQEARDVFALRKLVEAEVIRLLSGNLSDEAHTNIRACLEQDQIASKASLDRAHIHHSGDFHVLLARECGNGEIKNLIRRLVARTSLITQLFGNDRALECWHEEHVHLLDMLVAGSTEEATELMLTHLQSIEDELRLTPAKDTDLDLRKALLPPR